MKVHDSLLSKLEMIRELGFDSNAESIILDFGCGSGRRVQELRQLGFQAFGCDLAFKSDRNADTESLEREGLIRLIDKNRYVLPFPDNTFDVVFSDQVFEHVQNYSETLAELARVLKPGGVAFHLFPSRYTPLEPHVYVPLATVLRPYWWLSFWAFLGVRTEEQQNTSAKDTAIANFEYLRDRTHYLSKRQINKEFCAHFRQVLFGESAFLKYSPKGKYLYALSKVLPFLPSIYSTFRCRVVFARNPVKRSIQGVRGTPRMSEQAAG